MLDTSQQPNRDQFADTYAEAEALGKQVGRAQSGVEMADREKTNLAKISSLTRDQILEQLNKPDIAITAENYYQAIKLQNELLPLNPEQRREKLQTMSKEKQLLLVQALRFHALVEKLDDETKESLVAKEIGSKDLKATVRENIKRSKEEKRIQNMERELFADLELLVEEPGSKPLRVVKKNAA